MQRRRVNPIVTLGAAAALAALLAGCAGFGDSAVVENIKEGNFFKKPVWSTPDWAHVRPTNTASLGPKGPVPPDQLVDAAGRCAPAVPKVAPQAAQAEAKADEPAAPANKPAAPPAYGSLAGDLAGAPMPQGPAPKPMPKPTLVSMKTASTGPAGPDRLQPEGGARLGAGGAAPGGLLGGIALGMTECQAVQRGGKPSSVSIGSGKRGRRKVVITYLSGPWPGIYTFDSGRLKVVDAAPTQQKPERTRRYKKRRRPARTARGEDVYVQ
ncbi:MAG: hypothetical protein P8Y53_06990 [Pseudolabrys sp.]